jgi:hypothetical protein
MDIMVKLWNCHNRTIRVGRTRIPKGAMRPVLENLLWTERVQRLLNKKWLSRTDPKVADDPKPKVVAKVENKVEVKKDEVMTSAKPTTFDKKDLSKKSEKKEK